MITGISEIPFSLEIVINSTIQVWQCTLHSLWSCSGTASRCDSQITYLSKEMAVWHKLCVRWIVIECNFPQNPILYFLASCDDFFLPFILFSPSLKCFSRVFLWWLEHWPKIVHLKGILIEKWWTFTYIVKITFAIPDHYKVEKDTMEQLHADFNQKISISNKKLKRNADQNIINTMRTVV